MMPGKDRNGSRANLPEAGRSVGLATGTKLMTVDGFRGVETLRKGDYLHTFNGIQGKAQIIWIGWRRPAMPKGDMRQADAVRVLARAVADDVPLRDVVLAPDHGIFISGKFYFPRHLVNNASILWDNKDVERLWVVELARHNVISADGLPIESFLDEGRRCEFTDITAFNKA